MLKKRTIILLVVITVAIAVMIGVARHNGLDGNESSIVTYNDTESVEKAFSDRISIPSYVKQAKDTDISVISHLIVEIKNDDFVFRTGPFVDYKADLLGLYDTFTIDEQYDVNNDSTNITYIRFRQDLDSKYVHSILSWCDSQYSYELMINDDENLENMLNIINLNIDDLEEISDEQSDENSPAVDENTTSIKLINGGLIELPDTFNYVDITYKDVKGESRIYKYGDTTFMVVDYNDTGKYLEDFIVNSDNFEYKSFDQEVYIFYLSENPFDEGTDNYNTYNAFLEDTESFFDSMTIKDAIYTE